MKGILITTKRELIQILEHIKDVKDTQQFTLDIKKHKGLVYWHIGSE